MDFNTDIIFYHGTNKKFDTFEFHESFREGFLGALSKVNCKAFFFTTSKRTSTIFAENREEHFGGKANVKECYLSINNTLDLTGNFKYDRYINTDEGCLDTETERMISTKPATDEVLELINKDAAYKKLCNILGLDLVQEEIADIEYVKPVRSIERPDYKYSTEGLLLLLDNPDVIENIKKHGYDSVKCQESSFEGEQLGISMAVLSPEQIIETKNYKPKNENIKNNIRRKRRM